MPAVMGSAALDLLTAGIIDKRSLASIGGELEEQGQA